MKFAVHHQHGRLTRSDFDRLVEKLSGRLAQEGLGPGDRVAAVLPNGLELLATYYACISSGLVLAPINDRLTRLEIRRILTDFQPHCLLTTPLSTFGAEGPKVLPLERIDRWLEEAPGPGSDPGSGPVEPAPGSSLGRTRPAEIHDTDPAVLFYTSGSTGAPKGVVYSHRTLRENSRIYRARFGITPEDRSVLSHCMSQNFVFAQLTVPFLDAGAAVEIVDFGEPEQTLAAVEGGATFLSLIPWLGFRVIEAGRKRPPIPNRVRVAQVGGDRVPRRYFEEFAAVFGITPSELLGMSETNTYVTNPLVAGDERLGSCGTPFPEVQIEIRDTERRALPSGSVGEIWVNTPGAMEGYWGRPDLTREVMVGNWVSTGDAGFLDSDGYLWMTGRIKHIIICDGDNLQPREIEEAITRHPQVARAAVVGVPHPTRGETVGAAIVLEDGGEGLTHAELVGFLRESLTELKLPTHLVQLEALPMAASSKLDRGAVLSHLLEAGGAAP